MLTPATRPSTCKHCPGPNGRRQYFAPPSKRKATTSLSSHCASVGNVCQASVFVFGATAFPSQETCTNPSGPAANLPTLFHFVPLQAHQARPATGRRTRSTPFSSFTWQVRNVNSSFFAFDFITTPNEFRSSSEAWCTCDGPDQVRMHQDERAARDPSSTGSQVSG